MKLFENLNLKKNFKNLVSAGLIVGAGAGCTYKKTWSESRQDTFPTISHDKDYVGSRNYCELEGGTLNRGSP